MGNTEAFSSETTQTRRQQRETLKSEGKVIIRNVDMHQNNNKNNSKKNKNTKKSIRDRGKYLLDLFLINLKDTCQFTAILVMVIIAYG